MALHARSDLAAVTISPEHGGCGDLHSRPVDKGAPVKLWTLDCPLCEVALKKINDPHWSGTISGIPETPDEKQYREDQELKGKSDQQAQTAEAIAKLASLGDLPSAIAQLAAMFSGEPKRDRFDRTKAICTGCGESMDSQANFCGFCGLRSDVLTSKGADGFGPNDPVDLEALDEEQLRALAKERGLKPHYKAGKFKLIEMLSEV